VDQPRELKKTNAIALLGYFLTVRSDYDASRLIMTGNSS
jgi:hypothetical protein